MMGSCPLGGFYFPLLPLPLPASPLFLHIFIHLACFASLLPDSFGPVQGTMGIRGEGEHPSYDENIYIYIYYMMIMIIQSAGYPVMYIQMLQAQLWLFDTRRAITPFA